MECRHAHGDTVGSLFGWVCGQCFTILPERPVRYGLVPKSHNTGDKFLVARQQIVWQAEILKSPEGTTLSEFLRSIARRFTHRSGLDREAAFQAALDALKGLETPFGHPDHDWSRASAIDIADEEMTYWDQEPSGANT